MCIRDRIDAAHGHVTAKAVHGGVSLQRCSGSCDIKAAGTVSLAFDAMNGDAIASSDRGDVDVSVAPSICLLYTSDAADEGGRPRIVARAPKGHVALRALSWIDAIRRKVGLPEGFEKVRRSSSSSSSSS